MNFISELNKRTILVNEYLERYLKKNNNMQSLIYDAMKYSLFAGGKRLRPILLLSSYEVFNKNYKNAMPFACAIEMIHTYSLIHDDLPCMDDDDYRRGKLSNHKKFGEAIAVLAGDALLNKAFETSVDESMKLGNDSSLVLKALSVMANSSGTEGMIGGQVVDMFCQDLIDDDKKLKYMHLHKTGAIIRSSASIGALLGGASEEELNSIEIYAENLGLAFQVKDDILDVIGNIDILGKPIGSDEENHKATYVSLFGLEKSKLLEKELTEKAIESISIFGDRAAFLIDIAEYLLRREY